MKIWPSGNIGWITSSWAWAESLGLPSALPQPRAQHGDAQEKSRVQQSLWAATSRCDSQMCSGFTSQQILDLHSALSAAPHALVAHPFPHYGCDPCSRALKTTGQAEPWESCRDHGGGCAALGALLARGWPGALSMPVPFWVLLTRLVFEGTITQSASYCVSTSADSLIVKIYQNLINFGSCLVAASAFLNPRFSTCCFHSRVQSEQWKNCIDCALIVEFISSGWDFLCFMVWVSWLSLTVDTTEMENLPFSCPLSILPLDGLCSWSLSSAGQCSAV